MISTTLPEGQRNQLTVEEQSPDEQLALRILKVRLII